MPKKLAIITNISAKIPAGAVRSIPAGMVKPDAKATASAQEEKPVADAVPEEALRLSGILSRIAADLRNGKEVCCNIVPRLLEEFGATEGETTEQAEKPAQETTSEAQTDIPEETSEKEEAGAEVLLGKISELLEQISSNPDRLQELLKDAPMPKYPPRREFKVGEDVTDLNMCCCPICMRNFLDYASKGAGYITDLDADKLFGLYLRANNIL